MRKALFIGGVADGKMEDCGGLRYVKRMGNAPEILGEACVLEGQPCDIYRQERLYGKDHTFEIYILYSLSIDDAIVMLVNKYANK